METNMAPEVIVPTVFFLFLGAVILGPIWLRERTRQSGHKLVQQALERGQNVDPALVRELTGGKTPQAQPERARKTLGNGVILLALAMGLGAGGYFGDNDMYVPATILGALGAAFILLALVDYAEKKKEG
jgi:hypothetical protein